MKNPTKTPKININQLAALQGVSARTIRRWQRDGLPGPDAAGLFDLAACVGWAEARAKRSALSGRAASEKTELEAERLRVQIERLRVELAIRRQEYVSVAEVESETRRMVHNFRLVIEALPRKAAMTCAGRSASEVEKVLEAAVNEAMTQLHQGKWSDPVPAGL